MPLLARRDPSPDLRATLHETLGRENAHGFAIRGPGNMVPLARRELRFEQSACLDGAGYDLQTEIARQLAMQSERQGTGTRHLHSKMSLLKKQTSNLLYPDK